MAQFRDLTEFLVVPPKSLPVGGRTYDFPGTISGAAGLLLQLVQARAREEARARDEGRTPEPDEDLPEDLAGIDLREELLGGVDRDMVRDGCTSAQIEHCFATLMTWHMAGEDAAHRFWTERAGGPPPPNRAARRASAGSGTATPSPASTSGTSSPAAPRSRKPTDRRGTSS